MQMLFIETPFLFLSCKNSLIFPRGFVFVFWVFKIFFVYLHIDYIMSFDINLVAVNLSHFSTYTVPVAALLGTSDTLFLPLWFFWTSYS